VTIDFEFSSTEPRIAKPACLSLGIDARQQLRHVFGNHGLIEEEDGAEMVGASRECETWDIMGTGLLSSLYANTRKKEKRANTDPTIKTPAY
jgi:hypothetical protein